MCWKGDQLTQKHPLLSALMQHMLYKAQISNLLLLYPSSTSVIKSSRSSITSAKAVRLLLLLRFKDGSFQILHHYLLQYLSFRLHFIPPRHNIAIFQSDNHQSKTFQCLVSELKKLLVSSGHDLMEHVPDESEKSTQIDQDILFNIR